MLVGRPARRRLCVPRARAGAGATPRAARDCSHRSRRSPRGDGAGARALLGAARLRAAASPSSCCRSAARRCSGIACAMIDARALLAATLARAARAAAGLSVAAAARRGCRRCWRSRRCRRWRPRCWRSAVRRSRCPRRCCASTLRARSAGRDPARRRRAALDRGGRLCRGLSARQARTAGASRSAGC